MSYTPMILLIYGVYLDTSKVEKLKEICDLQGLIKDGECTAVPKEALTAYTSIPCPEDRKYIYKDGIQIPFSYNNGLGRDRYLHGADCYLPDGDSRCDKMCFDTESGEPNFFGIYCGEKGNRTDKLIEIAQNIPERVKENFERYCAPLLSAIGVEEEPKLDLIIQTW